MTAVEQIGKQRASISTEAINRFNDDLELKILFKT
jgi:hypothetical protein